MTRIVLIMLLGLWCTNLHAAEYEYSLKPEQIAQETWLLEGAKERFRKENGGNIVNIAFVVTQAGVVVFDTGPSRRYGEALRKAIGSVTDLPITHVFLTHHHPDHVFGNQSFPRERIGSLAGTRKLLKQQGDSFSDNMYRVIGDWMRGTELVMPAATLEPGILEIGGHVFELFRFTGHTGEDLVVLDRTTGTLFAGDMVFYNRALTTPQSPGFSAWLQDLDRLESLPFEEIVPGHGPVNEGESLDQMRDYLGWLKRLFEESAARGLTASEVMMSPIPPRFQGVAEARYELIRTTTHLYPEFEAAALDLLPQ